EQPEERDEDTWALPDLIVIDGGKGQLSRVIAAVHDLGVPLGVEGIDVVSLAKERKGMMPMRPTKGATVFAPANALAETSEAAAETPGALPGGPGALPETPSALPQASGTPPETPSARPQASGALPGKAYEDRVVAETFSTEDLEIRPERVFVPGIK